MTDVHAEDDRFSIWDVFKVSIDNQPIPPRYEDRFLNVAPVVLYFVEPHLGEIDIRLDTHAPDRNQFTAFHCFTKAEPMRRVSEHLECGLAVGPIGGRRKP